ncbi:ComF family protein [Hyphomicrobiales bacterium]|uniref:ComF family protein n=1 Tax=Agrobacterium sp. M50-1 TaxID=3132821 RepID=UPI000DD30C5B
MEVNLRRLSGIWDDGYALDKHMKSSTFVGYDPSNGHPRFDNIRTAAGEAVYQLKYQQNWGEAKKLAEAVFGEIVPKLPKIGLIIPMPASTSRQRQPVDEVASELAPLMAVSSFDNIIVKAASTSGVTLKNLSTKAEKEAELEGRFSINDPISQQGKWNVLLLDDLYDSGASMEAATKALRTYPKIDKIYIAALTWK